MPRTWPVVFRLYPERGTSLYVRVLVWPTRHAMRMHHRREGRDGAIGAAATCTSGRVQRFRRGRWRTLPMFAEVNLCRERMGTEIVTHEFLHAAIAWGRRVGFDFTRLDAEDSVNDDEERLCYAHGWLCRTFVERAIAAGLYDD